MDIGKATPGSTRFCAFCKHWYDPANSAIEPLPGDTKVWKFDRSANNKCLKSNMMRKGQMGCVYYECKI